MDDLDFSSPAPEKPKPVKPVEPPAAAQSPLYQPAVALEFFRSAGTVESKPGGNPVFSENEKSRGMFAKGARMYLLLEGNIGLMAGGKFVAMVKPGEIFGELAVIARLPCTATAFANTPCRLLSLDEKQFHAALEKKPEFALMLMSIMVNRLRQSLAKLGAGSAPKGGPTEREGVFDKKMLAWLANELSANSPTTAPAGRVILSAGATGALMYVVLEGKVTISVQDLVVERIGPGGVFGEMALVDRSPRAASATAESDCKLLTLGRDDFLGLVKANTAFGASLLKSLAERMQLVAAQVAGPGK